MSKEKLKSFNPFNEVLLGDVEVSSSSAIEDIVNQAKTAQQKWAELSFEERKAFILQFSDRVKSQANRLASLLTQEMGKPISDSQAEVARCYNRSQDALDEIITALEPTTISDSNVSTTHYYAPLGVCAVITPWNFPIAMIHKMVVPALMAGNAVIVKPSEETPLIAGEYVKIFNELLPTGLLSIVYGDEVQGKELVKADVNLIGFTGSIEAGKHILKSASDGLKHVILELGGKDPLIVLDDADIKAAARYAVFNSFRNAGQVCVSTERIYVDHKIAKDFLNEMVKLTAELKLGDGLNEATDIGPMINNLQREKVLDQLNEAISQGATVVYGDQNHPDRFINPTILTDLTHNMRIMREETFGPVVGVMEFSEISEAIQMANDTRYGLGAAVFGKDQNRAYEVGLQIEAGMVGVNQGCYGCFGSCWVGIKNSGYGYHGGVTGHRQFAELKTISRSVINAN